MSIPLLLANMPAAGPLGGGWSRWDIGCCCDVVELCGCTIVDNYEDTFSDGVLDAGWDTGDLSAQFLEQNNRMELSDVSLVDGRLSGVPRCLILPDMSAKKLTLEFSITNVESFLVSGLSDTVTLMVDTWSENTVNTCRPYNIGMGIHALCIFSGSTNVYSKPTTDVLAGDVSNTDVFRVDMEPDAGGKICKWYVNDVLIRSQVIPLLAGATGEPDLATLRIQWGAYGVSAIHLDNMTFGVYDL